MADLNSPYHILLGLPAFAKFMLVPHHPFLKMKLPGPQGVITVCGIYKKSLECSAAGSRLADSLVIAEERRQLDKVVAMAQAQVKAPLSSARGLTVQCKRHPATTPLGQSSSSLLPSW